MCDVMRMWYKYGTFLFFDSLQNVEREATTLKLSENDAHVRRLAEGDETEGEREMREKWGANESAGRRSI